MDVQLQELIDKIKKDGIASAEESAQNIIADAQNRAAQIVSDAEQKAETILKNAQAETKRMAKASEDAIAQAGRNMIISFRDALVAELDRLVQMETEKAYSKDLLMQLIPQTVQAWVKNTDAEELSVLLSEKDLKSLQSELAAALKAEIANGLELKPDKTLSAGFRIGVKDGTAYYDYSAESLADLFSSYLNPRTANILKGAVKE
ncbi:MAG: V-type ATP synthase subunit E [Treponema sp.]|nr:V-type ATP synthase subunit E [Treponema sp.]